MMIFPYFWRNQVCFFSQLLEAWVHFYFLLLENLSISLLPSWNCLNSAWYLPDHYIIAWVQCISISNYNFLYVCVCGLFYVFQWLILELRTGENWTYLRVRCKRSLELLKTDSYTKIYSLGLVIAVFSSKNYEFLYLLFILNFICDFWAWNIKINVERWIDCILPTMHIE